MEIEREIEGGREEGREREDIYAFAPNNTRRGAGASSVL